MLKTQAIDPPMTGNEIIHFISVKMTLQHRKQAQHRRTEEASGTGSRGMCGRRMRTLPHLPPLSSRTSQRAVRAPPMPAEANLRVRTLRFQCRQWTSSWRRCTGCNPPARRTQPASGRCRAARLHRKCQLASTARSKADQTARAAAMSATGGIVITVMMTRAAR